MTVNLTSTDNLALAAAIRDLQAQVTTLRRSSLQLGPHQMGSVAGEASNVTLRASRILPPNFTGPYMELDLTQVPTNNTMGSSPAIHVNDGTRERVQMGNLPAYTDPRGVSSPAGYGFRVLDSAGNILFDSIGISVVMTRIATSSHGYPGAGNRAGTVGPPTGPQGGGEVLVTSTPFTLTRTQTVRIDGLISGFVAGNGAGTPDLVYIRVSGQTNTPAMGAFHALSPISANAYTYQVIQLPAGTYTANLYWESLNGGTDILNMTTYSLDVFLMGG